LNLVLVEILIIQGKSIIVATLLLLKQFMNDLLSFVWFLLSHMSRLPLQILSVLNPRVVSLYGAGHLDRAGGRSVTTSVLTLLLIKLLEY
jgi:hypothetical protein